jgi:hypothetical protein
MPECVHADLEHMSLLLLKPRSPSIAIFLIVSEKGIARSETHASQHMRNTETNVWLFVPGE